MEDQKLFPSETIRCIGDGFSIVFDWGITCIIESFSVLLGCPFSSPLAKE